MGMRNHEVVPVELIQSISKLKKGNVNRTISNLLKHKTTKILAYFIFIQITL